MTDSLPAIAIGMEPSDESLLEEKPRDPSEGILNREFLWKMGGWGSLIGIATIAAYTLGLRQSAALASTMAFATLTLARLFHGFSCREKKSLFRLGLWSNKYSVFAFFAGVALLALVLFVPYLHKVFLIAEMSAANIGFIAGLALMPTVVIQIWKVCAEMLGRKDK